MKIPAKPFKLGAAILLAIIALGFVVRRAGALWQSGEEGARIYFYDQSEKKLYTVPNDTIPPHHGIGGQKDDGVRAVVVAFGAPTKNPADLRIAYLESHAPELKSALEEIRPARIARKPYAGPVISPESEFFQTNSLVKRTEDKNWSPLVGATGRAITFEGRSWRGPAANPQLFANHSAVVGKP